MAHFSSEIQDVPPKDESTGSETSIRSPLCDYTLTEDSVLRSMIEEAAFQALCEEVVIKMPRYTFSVSETDELNDFISLNFPQKLWKIVESDQFKSIWWDESGTSIVINEEVFKKEVLERKAPFRIFETDSMKSLVRQLNLYGFRKKQQTFQRSASLADFLEEENNVSVLSKSSYFGLMVEPSKFPVRYSDMSVYDSPFPNLQQRANSWSPVPRIRDTSASSLSKSTHQKSSLYENHPN
ncbi:heat shock transcription factor, Y-linked-like isoform X3 [Odocoileus virginianus]|uniref:Heat shock transcription factor, Y-linked-like isoform X3 n=1 Tax=Odocoileus virginianus TaxID=9874 RepID=A0ABM4HTT6_ODOVR